MKTNNVGLSRRDLLGATAAGMAAGICGFEAKAADQELTVKDKETVRDRLWAWAHMAGVYNGGYGRLPGDSLITPVEGAYYLGVPNIIFVRWMGGQPTPPFEQFATPFKSLKKVHWSITGAGGKTSQEEREAVYQLAADTENITGVFMDDFFKQQSGEGPITVEELKEIRRRLDNIDGRRLDIGVTLYTYQLDPNIMPHIELCDVVSLWTWYAKDLKDIESNFATLKRMMPSKRILLGCYMWDFGSKAPMPLDLMEKQCSLGLKWLKEGQIEGMIFLATNICDLKLDAVEWTRKWIAEVGDQVM